MTPSIKDRVNSLSSVWSSLPADNETKKLEAVHAELCFHAIEARQYLLERGMLGLYFIDPVTSDVFGMLNKITTEAVNALHGCEYDLSGVYQMNRNSDFEIGMMDKIDFAERERRHYKHTSVPTGGPQ